MSARLPNTTITRSVPCLSLVLLASCLGGGGDDGAEPLAPACPMLLQLQDRLGARIHGEVEPMLALEFYIIADDGTVSAPGGEDCMNVVASRLAPLCELCERDPGHCESAVRSAFAEVPAECSACGDGACITGESEQNCAVDCADNCGDGLCAAVESAVACPVDCAQACGDSLCSGTETPTSCPTDCTYSVGDGVCSGGENPVNSPADCGRRNCGDGYCQSYEDNLRCPEDCCLPQRCDDGFEYYCSTSHELSRCVDGEDGCPVFEPEESCELGCAENLSDQPLDPLRDCPNGGCSGAACRSCWDVRNAIGVGASDWACELGDPPRCAHPVSGRGNVFSPCVEVPGFPSCGYRESIECLAGTVCTPDGCIDCATVGCEHGTSRCSDGGVRQQCVQESGATCGSWRDLPCAGDTECIEVPGGEPGAETTCGVAETTCFEHAQMRCAGGTSPQQCVVPSGQVAGTWIDMPACDDGQRCDIAWHDSSSQCAPECSVGQTRCNGIWIERCVSGGPAGTWWTILADCAEETGRYCVDAGTSFYCQP